MIAGQDAARAAVSGPSGSSNGQPDDGRLYGMGMAG